MSIEEQAIPEVDPFSERRAFPEAAAVFAYLPPRLVDAKPDCVVVLDTNVLLVPYTITPKSLKEIEETYKSLVTQKRLFIPAQVAREFARNRALKLGELFQQLTNKRSVKRLQTGVYPLLESVPEHQKVRGLEKDIDAKYSEYDAAMSALLDAVRGWNWNDPVSILYKSLFTADLIVDEKIDDKALREDLDARVAAKVPPGYKDAAKRTNAAGDLVIWHTILDIGKVTKRPMLFVSGDSKSDWWHKSSGQTLYPRYELIDEYRRASGGAAFFIVPFSEFLELFGAGSGAVEEVKKEEVAPILVSSDEGTEDLHAVMFEAERAVGVWLRRQFQGSELVRERSRGAIDFVVVEPSGRRLGVDVKVFRHPRAFSANRITREMAYRSFYEIQSGHITDYLLCVVTPTPALASDYAAVLSRLVLRGPPISVSIGIVVNSHYNEVTRVQTLGDPGSSSTAP